MRIFLSIFMLLCAVIFLYWLNDLGVEKRALPERTADPKVFWAVAQKDLYGIYKEHGLWGVRVIQLNRYMNLVDFSPPEMNKSTPFPVNALDVSRLYEKGLDSHNWLFIATRTGMVRQVTSVLPEEIFQQKYVDLMAEPSLSFAEGKFMGFIYDSPWTVSSLQRLLIIEEPVVVNVDSGYFDFGQAPSSVASQLKEKFQDIRMMVLSESQDEPEVSSQARLKLREFGRIWESR